MYILVTVKDRVAPHIDSMGEKTLEMQAFLETEDFNTAIIQTEGAFAKFQSDIFPTTILKVELFTNEDESVFKKSNAKKAKKLLKTMSEEDKEQMIIKRFKGE